MAVQDKNFLVTITNNDASLNTNVEQDIVGYIRNAKAMFSMARQPLERIWEEAWAMYLGTPTAMAHLRNQVLTSVGDVNQDWRHKINVGKGFEAVETIHSYLMQATFPNNQWFNAQPTAPNYADTAKVVAAYVRNKLDTANFRSSYANFLRQLVVTGLSVIALPWRKETIRFKKRVPVKVPRLDGWTADKDGVITYDVVEEMKMIHNEPDFDVLDVFDVWLDPTEKASEHQTLIRRLTKTRADVINMARQRLYDIKPLDVMKLPTRRMGDDSWRSQTIRNFEGITLSEDVSMSDEVELYEYWGDVHLNNKTYHDVHAVISGEHLLVFEPNPYWCGHPFVIGTYIPLSQQPYGVGAVQPNLGLLHELNIITNQRLDNLEISVDSMWKFVDDGVVNPEDVYTEPGRVIAVGDMNNLAPIEMPQQFIVTYQESQFLENKINANFGTPPLIGTGEVRAGERVTATEIQAVKDAGGNRLSGIFKHIEDTSLKPLLGKIYRLIQQFVTEEEVVSVAGFEAGSVEYYQVSPELFAYDFILKPIGADHVVDRDRYVQDRVQFLQIAAQYPEMAQLLNFERVLLDIVAHFGFDDPQAYIKEAPPPQQQGDPAANQMRQEIDEMGGDHLQAALAANEQATGSNLDLFNTLMAEDPEADVEEQAAQNVNPEDLM
jgi:hypothetical protein